VVGDHGLPMSCGRDAMIAGCVRAGVHGFAHDRRVSDWDMGLQESEGCWVRGAEGLKCDVLCATWRRAGELRYYMPGCLSHVGHCTWRVARGKPVSGRWCLSFRPSREIVFPTTCTLVLGRGAAEAGDATESRAVCWAVSALRAHRVMSEKAEYDPFLFDNVCVTSAGDRRTRGCRRAP
jgi:hypothetical protein